MKKKLKKIISQKWFYLYLVPLVLFFVGSLITFWNIINLDTHYTVMPIVHKESGAMSRRGEEVTDTQRIHGEFVSSEPNLGAVGIAIRDRHEEAVEDDFKVFFRIKEKDAKEWLSTNSYSGGQFQELDRFPFGFGLINDAKGKTYVYELYTKGVGRQNALSISDNAITTFHQLNKSDLKNPVFAFQYLIGKLWFALQNPGVIFASLVYFLPLYAYYYFLHESEKIKLPKFFSYLLLIHFIDGYILSPVVLVINRFLTLLARLHVLDEVRTVKRVPLLNIILFFVIIGEIFLISGINNLLLLIILLLWSISVVLYKFRVDSSFLIAILFLVLCFVFYLVGLEEFAEKAAVWTYLFLLIGGVQSLLMQGIFSRKIKNRKSNELVT